MGIRATQIPSGRARKDTAGPPLRYLKHYRHHHPKTVPIPNLQTASSIVAALASAGFGGVWDRYGTMEQALRGPMRGQSPRASCCPCSVWCQKRRDKAFPAGLAFLQASSPMDTYSLWGLESKLCPWVDETLCTRTKLQCKWKREVAAIPIGSFMSSPYFPWPGPLQHSFQEGGKHVPRASPGKCTRHNGKIWVVKKKNN